jgi:RNA polymerase sigma-70 factor (ECF subfamily)
MSGGYITLQSEAARAASFDFVFATYFSFVSKLARALLGNVQDAEDVTQEVFLRVYKNLPSYDPERGTMNAWLGKLTVNASRTHQRRSIFHRMWRSSSLDDNAEEVSETMDPSLFGAPEEYFLQAELRKSVAAMLAKLRPKHRTVLVLHHYMELSCVEIAAILDCPEGTVYSRLYHARRLVQTQLEQQMQAWKSEAEL